MKKIKRVLAIAGVVILVGLYAVTLISAICATPAAKDFFLASVIATMMIPILIYVYLLIHRLVTGRQEDEGEKIQKKDKGFDEAFERKEP